MEKLVEKEFKSVETLSVFNAVSVFTSKNDLPFDMQWELDDLGEAFEKYAKRFLEDRNKLIKKYDGKIDETGIEIPDDKSDKFNAELIKLTEVKVKVSFAPFRVDKLKKLSDNIREKVIIDGMNMRNLRKLGVFIGEEKKEEEQKVEK